MKKQINNLLIKMQTGENCIDKTVNKLLNLFNVRLMLRKEYCNACGQELTEIRGRYPKEPRRKVCACCATEKLEWQEEKKNIGTCKSD